MIPSSFGVYVIRVWREPDGDGPGAWRASVTDTVTRQRTHFSDPDALAGFLGGLGAPVPTPRPDAGAGA